MNKRLILSLMLVYAALACLAGCAAVRYTEAGEASPAPGSMRVRVMDGMDDAPIPGARVVFPEDGLEFATDADGLTPLIELPCRIDAAHSSLCPMNEGRTTMIVYAEGRVPYVLLYMRVLSGETRDTPTVYMFPDDGTIPVFEVIESPPIEWAAALADKYSG